MYFIFFFCLEIHYFFVFLLLHLVLVKRGETNGQIQLRLPGYKEWPLILLFFKKKVVKETCNIAYFCFCSRKPKLTRYFDVSTEVNLTHHTRNRWLVKQEGLSLQISSLSLSWKCDKWRPKKTSFLHSLILYLYGVRQRKRKRRDKGDRHRTHVQVFTRPNKQESSLGFGH